MRKEFDVHFTLQFRDFFSKIEANSKSEAEGIALEWLANPDTFLTKGLAEGFRVTVELTPQDLEPVVDEVLESE